MQKDPGRKTYFEAIKCSPMKLRHSLANIKRPKLEENFTLKPSNTTALGAKEFERPNNPSTSIESMEDLTNSTLNKEKPSSTGQYVEKPVEMKTGKSKTSLGIVELQNDETGELGSLCFRKSLLENLYSDNLYSRSNMVGGKLRKVHRGSDGVLLSGRRKSKDLLVRCESIMIYPKVLVNQKEPIDKNKFTGNSKQQSEKYEVDTNYQHLDKVVTNFQNRSSGISTKLDGPKEAWNDSTSQSQRRISVENSENIFTTRLPQLNNNDFRTGIEKTSPETALDNCKPLSESHAVIVNHNEKLTTESQNRKQSASTKIIIPFGENELTNKVTERNRSKNEHLGEQKDVNMKPKCLLKEMSNIQKVHDGVVITTGLQKENDKGNNQSKQNNCGEIITHNTIIKQKYLKESSKLNEQLHLSGKVCDQTMYGTRTEIPRKLAIPTQYLSMTTPCSPIKKFRIPTGVENKLLVERENYPPKTNAAPYRFVYNQKDVSARNVDVPKVKKQDNRGQSVSLNVGGKGLLKMKLPQNEEISVEDEKKKRVQFLVRNSRYFTQ